MMSAVTSPSRNSVFHFPWIGVRTMKINRQQHFLPSLCMACALSAAMLPGLATASEKDVSARDPQRWYQSNDTPKLHYQNLLKEAQAALNQALQECKTIKGSAAQACRSEARHHYADDKARAKRILKLLDTQPEVP
jgi:hypothetical protein